MLLWLAHALLSFSGRITRTTFWCLGLGLAALFLMLLVFLDSELGRRSSLVIYPFFIWMMVALWVKRLRDRGRSPLALLWFLLPVAGPLYLFVEMGCRRGTVGENQYGPDPYDDRPDYLTVA